MTELEQLAQKIRSFNLAVAMQDAVKKNKDLITNLNRQQIRAGRTNQDKSITPDYAESYSAFKESLSSYKASPGVPDLFVTGSFQSLMQTRVIRNDVIIISTDSKTGQLLLKYDGIFGLNQRSLDIAIPENDRKLLEIYKKHTGL